MGRMRWGTAKPTLRRPTRRSLGLADNEQVVTMWAGPPELTLEDRAGTLQACRHLLATDGYRVAHVSPGIIELRMRRRAPKVLTGDDALAALERDEAVADADEHWWLHDVVWSDPATSRHVCAGVDPDGNDLTWIGWGDQQVGDTIERLQEMLRSRRPQAPGGEGGISAGDLVEYLGEPVFDLIIRTGDIGTVTRTKAGWVYARWPRATEEHGVPLDSVRPVRGGRT
jgi:hypothetical protein